MSIVSIQNRLFQLRDSSYAEFQRQLVPTLAPERIIGVRLPQLRRLAKTLSQEASEPFLRALPHSYYDENMLHAILLSEMRAFEECLAAVERFLPFIDNWAVCDTLSPKVFKEHRPELLLPIRRWSVAAHGYQRRFAITMLMRHFLDEDFKPAYLAIPMAMCSDEYYVNMAIAWFFATALAKQWASTIGLIEEQRLAPWVHNKTIQKARESYRITTAQKDYLLSLKQAPRKQSDGGLAHN